MRGRGARIVNQCEPLLLIWTASIPYFSLQILHATFLGGGLLFASCRVMQDRMVDDGDVFESLVRLKAEDQFLNKAAHEF